MTSNSVGPASDSLDKLQANDIGLYGSAWVSWLRGNPSDVDFLIYQSAPSRPLKLIRSDLRFASDAGIKIILTLKSGVPDSADPKAGVTVPLLQDFTRVLDNIGDLPVWAVTIGEENVFWDGRAERLSEIYSKLRKRYPKYRFFQWYSPSRNLNIPGRGWPSLPANGWVFDQYHMTKDVYAEYLEGMSLVDGSKVSVVWASPLWRPGSRTREANFEWWERDGWRLLYEQVKLNKSHNIPTALYLYDLAGFPVQPSPLFKSNSQCVRRFVEALFDRTVPALRALSNLDAAPPARPEWIPGGCG